MTYFPVNRACNINKRVFFYTIFMRVLLLILLLLHRQRYKKSCLPNLNEPGHAPHNTQHTKFFAPLTNILWEKWKWKLKNWKIEKQPRKAIETKHTRTPATQAINFNQNVWCKQLNCETFFICSSISSSREKKEMLWTGLFTIAASYERLFRAINNKTKFNCSYKWGNVWEV